MEQSDNIPAIWNSRTMFLLYGTAGQYSCYMEQSDNFPVICNSRTMFLLYGTVRQCLEQLDNVMLYGAARQCSYYLKHSDMFLLYGQSDNVSYIEQSDNIPFLWNSRTMFL